jgi:2-oxoglutarate ferredoxin oxidoreductase subunit alpha
VPVIRRALAADAFDCAIEACRIATSIMTPVMLLTDGYIANAAEPWRVPDMSGYQPFPVTFFDTPPAEGRRSCLTPRRRPRAAVDQAGHARPRASHRRHREAAGTGNIDYSPGAHQEMTDTRAAKVLGIANSIPDQDDLPRPRGRRAGGGRLGLDLRADPPGGAPRDRGGKDVATSTSGTSWPAPKNLGPCSRVRR